MQPPPPGPSKKPTSLLAKHPLRLTIPTSVPPRPGSFRFRPTLWIWLSIGLAYLLYQLQQPLTSPSDSSDHLAICCSGGTIYTAELDNPFVECVVIKHGLITFVGKRQDVKVDQRHSDWRRKLAQWLHLSRFGSPPQTVLLTGQMSVLPGLIDAHAHPLERGDAKLGVDLLGCTTTRCVADRLVHHIKSRPDLTANPKKFVRGDGWDQTLFEDQRFPTAADISNDPLLRGRRIALRRVDFHAYWVSTAVVELALSNDPDQHVEGGEIVRDEAGHPTGIFLDNAMNLINNIMPNRTDTDRLVYLKSTAEEMLSVGLTGVHDAAVDLATVEFYKQLDISDKLPVRVSVMIDCGYVYCGDRVQRYEGPKLSVRSVKLFVDGALGSWGAALWSPYNDHPLSRGILRSPEDTFIPLIQQWVTNGFQVNSHAIGDRANTIVLDAYEHVLNGLNATNDRPFNFPRLRVEHAQILRPADVERMGRLGIIASVQPTHAVADMDYAEARLGPERIRGAYAWNSLLKNNATLALGSDFPVSPVSPFLGIHAAFTRKKPIPSSRPSENVGWYPEERIETMEEIINGFTTHASFAGFNEDKVGSLAIGKRADLIIVNRNLFDRQKSREQIGEEILQVQVLATLLDGKVVFGNL